MATRKTFPVHTRYTNPTLPARVRPWHNDETQVDCPKDCGEQHARSEFIRCVGTCGRSWPEAHNYLARGRPVCSHCLPHEDGYTVYRSFLQVSPL